MVVKVISLPVKYKNSSFADIHISITAPGYKQARSKTDGYHLTLVYSTGRFHYWYDVDGKFVKCNQDMEESGDDDGFATVTGRKSKVRKNRQGVAKLNNSHFARGLRKDPVFQSYEKDAWKTFLAWKTNKR